MPKRKPAAELPMSLTTTWERKGDKWQITTKLGNEVIHKSGDMSIKLNGMVSALSIDLAAHHDKVREIWYQKLFEYERYE